MSVISGFSENSFDYRGNILFLDLQIRIKFWWYCGHACILGIYLIWLADCKSLIVLHCRCSGIPIFHKWHSDEGEQQIQGLVLCLKFWYSTTLFLFCSFLCQISLFQLTCVIFMTTIIKSELSCPIDVISPPNSFHVNYQAVIWIFHSCVICDLLQIQNWKVLC